jgi:UDP-N-acetylmuramate dehydrogenase
VTTEELVPIGRKTTMHIGGQARYFAELATKDDVEKAWEFAKEKKLPLIPLGGGSNTVFADGVIEAVVVKINSNTLHVVGNVVTVRAGKILANLINELADMDLDLSALTGIPGTVGGALVGNAGQGAKGIWMDHFVESVTAFFDGNWNTFSKKQCNFRYRESGFKDLSDTHDQATGFRSTIIWDATLIVPSRPAKEIKAEVESLLKKRIETQPHIKTAGSCFKSLTDGTPAWKLIDAAGLRGQRFGDVQISEKHANFLLNIGKASFQDIVSATRTIRRRVPEIAGIEMRMYGNDGRIVAVD